MRLSHQLVFRVALATAVAAVPPTWASGQGLRPAPSPAPSTAAAVSNQPADASPAVPPAAALKPSPGIPASPMADTAPRSMLEEPAAPAKIQLTGDQLSINATNASLSELIRQVAERTGMQVEGNSREVRVFGVYGPGSPSDVLSSLLYDSGYNVIMLGQTAEGAPRKLVLSSRPVGAAPQGAAPPMRSTDEDDEDPSAQPAYTPPPAGTQTTPGQSGQVKTPQQMLEELQRMHQSQQPQQQ